MALQGCRRSMFLCRRWWTSLWPCLLASTCLFPSWSSKCPRFRFHPAFRAQFFAHRGWRKSWWKCHCPRLTSARTWLAFVMSLVAPQRAVPREPQLAEQLVDVPVPSLHQCMRMADFRDDGGRRWCLITGSHGYSWWLVGTDHHQGETPPGITASPGVEDISTALCIWQSLVLCGSRLRSAHVDFLVDSFRIRRIQRFLVRQWIHVISRLRRLFLLGSCVRFSSCSLVLCLPRRVQENWISWCPARVDNGIGMLGLVLLVSTHFALCSLFFVSVFSAKLGPQWCMYASVYGVVELQVFLREYVDSGS